MSSLPETVSELVREDYRGPPLSFSKFHVLKALLVLGAWKRVGRSSLAEAVGLGEGAVRTLLRRLKQEELVDIDRSGCTLTSEGRQLYSTLRSRIPVEEAVDVGDLSPGNVGFLVIVRGVDTKSLKGIAQRDAAVRAGGSGATTMVYRNGQFVLPPDEVDAEEEYPIDMWDELKSKGLTEDDVVIIAGSDTKEDAERAALAAAWTLINNG